MDLMDKVKVMSFMELVNLKYNSGKCLSQILYYDSFKVHDISNINKKSYSNFLDKMFFEWYSSQPSSCILKRILHKRLFPPCQKAFKDNKLMECPVRF